MTHRRLLLACIARWGSESLEKLGNPRKLGIFLCLKNVGNALVSHFPRTNNESEGPAAYMLSVLTNE